MHAITHSPYSTVTARLPPISVSMRRGEWRASQIVDAPCLTGGTIVRRSRGTPMTTATPRSTTTIKTMSTLARSLASTSPSCRDSGMRATATMNTEIWTSRLTAPISAPPDATASAIGMPCFCRKRICTAAPPT